MKNSLAPTSVYMTAERSLSGERRENEERILKATPPPMQTNFDKYRRSRDPIALEKTQASRAVRYAFSPASTAPATLAFTSSTVSCARRVHRFPVAAAPSKPCFSVPVMYSRVFSPEEGAKSNARSAPTPIPTANVVNLSDQLF